MRKIRVGFQRALHKRPVPTEYVDAAIDRIVQRVLSLGEREVPSRQIGEMVMQELYKLDKVGLHSLRLRVSLVSGCLRFSRCAEGSRSACRGGEAIPSLSGGALAGVSPAYGEPGVDSRF